MNILALDTSTDHLSIAFTRDGKIAGRFHRMVGRKHSVLLVPTIDKVLKAAKMKINNVDLFCISIGPGSFTGLRIGVTVVKGLAYAIGKPIVAVPTMDVIAWNAKKHRGILCPVLDARKNKVYAAFYRSSEGGIKRISDYYLLPVAELLKKLEEFQTEKIVFLGDGAHYICAQSSGRYSEENCVEKWHPKADVVAQLGMELFKNNKITNCEKLEPFYIYSKECDITGI